MSFWVRPPLGRYLLVPYGVSPMLAIAGLAMLLGSAMLRSVAAAQASAAEPALTDPIPPMPTAEAVEVLRLLREETVITAIRHEQPISEAPSNIYVITDEDIRRSGATDLPTILRRIPGIEVIQMTGADFNVSARGDNQLSANKMLVMVDGRSIYDDEQGTVLWKAIPVTLPEIKRIEVLKGPASALYGFNAFDGVVHIITKSPEEMKGVTAQVGGGEFGTLTGAAVAAGTYGKLGYRLSAGWDQNNQWRDRDALAFRGYKFNAHTEYALPGLSKLQFAGGLADVDRFDGPIVGVVQASQTFALGYARAAYERPNFFLRAFWTRLDQPSDIGANPRIANFLRVTDRKGSSEQLVKWNSYDVEAQHALEFGTANRLTYGLNYRHNAVSSNFLDEFSTENRLGLYVQNEWHATQRLTAVAGLRYDLHSEISPTPSPRIALLYRPVRDHTFRAAVSVAFRPPTLFETNLESFPTVTIPIPPFPPFMQTSVIRGSHGLDPERIISYDIGYQGWLFKYRLRLRADFFFNQISDLIGTQSPGPGLPPELRNGGEADIYGGEVGVEFLATPWLSSFANIAYQEIDQTFTGEVRRGGPQFKVNAGLRGEWNNGLSGELLIHYVGAATFPIDDLFSRFVGLPGSVPPPETRVNSYTLLNLRAAYHFWDEKAEVAVAVFNALNDRHREHPLGDIIGSRVMGWLTIRY